MNKVWEQIFKSWIDSYEAIRTLTINGIIDGDDNGDYEFKIKLLDEIIETCRTEVEE